MKNILIAIFLLPQIYAQFLDSASPIEFEDLGKLSKANSVFTLTGSSKKITEIIKIDGAVLRFDGDSASSVKIQYVFSSCLLYTSPSPRDGLLSRMPSSA